MPTGSANNTHPANLKRARIIARLLILAITIGLLAIYAVPMFAQFRAGTNTVSPTTQSSGQETTQEPVQYIEQTQ